MIKEKIVLENEVGMHARPATELVKLAGGFKCNVLISYNGKEVNAKSMLGVMSLGIKYNTELELICDGEDEEEAMSKIKEAFKNRFGE